MLSRSPASFEAKRKNLLANVQFATGEWSDSGSVEHPT